MDVKIQPPQKITVASDTTKIGKWYVKVKIPSIPAVEFLGTDLKLHSSMTTKWDSNGFFVTTFFIDKEEADWISLLYEVVARHNAAKKSTQSEPLFED